MTSSANTTALSCYHVSWTIGKSKLHCLSLGLSSFQYSSLYIPISQRQSSDASIAARYSIPAVTRLLGYRLHDWRNRRSDHTTAGRPHAKPTFSEKWVNFGKYRIGPNAMQTASRFRKFTDIANTLHNRPDALPPLRSSEPQRHYLGNRLILMSCGKARIGKSQPALGVT